MSVNLPLQHLSGAGIVIYAFTVTFAAIDWIMSINPHWYSTLFGFLFIGGQGLSALAFTIVDQHVPRAAGADGGPAQAEPLPRPRQAVVRVRHALGLLQLLAVPARVRGEPGRGDPVLHRQDQPRLAVPRAVPRHLPFRGAVPAAALARPEADAVPARLGGAGCCSSCATSTCSCWCRRSSTPRARTCTCCAGEHESDFFVHWLDLAAPLAIGGLWLWMFFTQLAQRPLLAFGDPYLREALESSGRPLMAHQHDAVGTRAPADAEYLDTPPGSTYEHTDAQRLDHRQVPVLAGRLGGPHPRRPRLLYPMLIERAMESGRAALSAGGDAGQTAAPDAAAAAVPEERALRLPCAENKRFSNGYGWMNKEAGIVHIPIEEAMRLTVERGLPSRTPADGAALETPGMMPSDASSGRVMERATAMRESSRPGA